jgi:hypothetical protein
VRVNRSAATKGTSWDHPREKLVLACEKTLDLQQDAGITIAEPVNQINQMEAGSRQLLDVFAHQALIRVYRLQKHVIKGWTILRRAISTKNRGRLSPGTQELFAFIS